MWQLFYFSKSSWGHVPPVFFSSRGSWGLGKLFYFSKSSWGHVTTVFLFQRHLGLVTAVLFFLELGTSNSRLYSSKSSWGLWQLFYCFKSSWGHVAAVFYFTRGSLGCCQLFSLFSRSMLHVTLATVDFTLPGAVGVCDTLQYSIFS